MDSTRVERRRERLRRRRGVGWLRARAILAGGLVFGIGAAVTLAAWTDNEYTTATVASGRFGIVGSMNGGPFGDHSQSPGATLTFTPGLGAVYPGSAASFTAVQVRTASVATGSTFDSVPGVVQMQTATAPTDALAAALVYAVRIAPAASSCNQALFDGATAPTIVPNGTPLTTAVASSAANSQALQAAGGNTVTYCIRIALPSTAPDGIQGITTSVTWQFAGTTP